MNVSVFVFKQSKPFNWLPMADEKNILIQSFKNANFGRNNEPCNYREFRTAYYTMKVWSLMQSPYFY